MMQYWLPYALLGPVLWAISTHIDKYMVERYFLDVHPAVLLVFTGLVNLALLPVFAVLVPGIFELAPRAMLSMMLAGVLLMGAIMLYLLALRSEEASVVSPFFQASPLFAIGLSYFVLGEQLTPPQAAGAALVLMGTLSVAFVEEGREAGAVKIRLIVLMLGCAFALALSSLVFKIFSRRDEFWQTTFWLFAGQGAFALIVLALAPMRRQFQNLLKEQPGALFGINGANELISVIGMLGQRYALALAPLSLVQVVGSTTTIFVFVIGLALTLFAPRLGREDMSRRSLVRKGMAAALVAGGVALIEGSVRSLILAD